jgi:hypothetical protein
LFNLWVCSPSTENKRKEINSPYARAIGIPTSSPVHPHLYIRKTKALWLTVLNFFLSSAPRHVSSSPSDLLTRHHKAGVQQQDSGARPGPEHKKLEYFLGTSKVETEIKANEYVPAGKGVTTATVTLGRGDSAYEFGGGGSDSARARDRYFKQSISKRSRLAQFTSGVFPPRVRAAIPPNKIKNF